MGKIDVIKASEKLIPLEVLESHLSNGMTLRNFLENKFVELKSFGENVTPESIVYVVVDKFLPLTDANVGKDAVMLYMNNMKYVKEWISNRVGYLDTIQVGPSEFMNVTEHLENAVKRMDENHLVMMGPVKRDIDYLYMRAMEGVYRAPTFDDVIDLVTAIEIPEEIKGTIVESHNISVEDYMSEVLPYMVVDGLYVMKDGVKIPVETFVFDLFTLQKENVLLEQLNRTGENPSLVSEIQVALNPDKTVDTVSSDNITMGDSFSEKEIEELVSNIFVNTPENYYRDQINSLLMAIKGVNDLHNIEYLEGQVHELYEEALQQKDAVTPFVWKKFEELRDTLEAKKNNIIKVSANEAEYLTALDNQISYLYGSIEEVNNMDELSEVVSKIKRIERDLEDKGIHNNEVKRELERLNDMVNKKRVRVDAFIDENTKGKNDVMEEIRDLKSSIKRMTDSKQYVATSTERAGLDIKISVLQTQLNDRLNYVGSLGIFSEEEIRELRGYQDKGLL